MIIFDTETTGLIENETLPWELQPRILEIGALQVDYQLNEIGRFHALLRPPGYQLTEEIGGITGLTQTEIDSGREFPEVVPALYDFFCGDGIMMAHNVNFDVMMLVYELRRIGWEHRFAYPRQQIDSMVFWPGKLSEWGVKCGLPAQRHRAIADCELLLGCYRVYVGEQEARWTR